ncbi:hypothetical protein SESBI_06722 [Sesbania bispinosa]|nr:hypothetical protein SESBI_06722 [Sesbania bispinosa]
MNMMFTVESQKSVPAPFLTKTYQLVDDPCTDHIGVLGVSRRWLLIGGSLQMNTSKKELSTFYVKSTGEKSPQHYQQHYHDQIQPPQLLQPDENLCWMDPPSPPPKSGTDILTALSEDNQRLRRKNLMLISELTHMKNLYNDIIYFIQNHVNPAPFEQRSSSAILKLVELDSSPNVTGAIKPPAKSFVMDKSLIASSEDSNSSVKLFGVPLCGKKRLHPGKP